MPKQLENHVSRGRTSADAAPTHAQGVTLSIVIVNYNVKEFLEQTLSSARKAIANIDAEIIVVDNASTDGSVVNLRKKFRDITFIENEQNLGFAKASNQGLKIAKGEYLALLNPDTIVQENTFRRMLAFFERHPDTGLLGCKILNPDGSLQPACRRSFPTPWVAFTKLVGLSYLFPKSPLFGRYNLTHLDANVAHEVEALSGSFMIIRRAALEDVGYLDESFFLYGEDLDWCYRVYKSGWKVRYTPDTQIIHFKGESSKRAEFDNLKIFYRAMGRFANKHFRRRYLFVPYWLLWVAIWLHASVSFVVKLLKVSAGAVLDIVLTGAILMLSMLVRFGDLGYLESFLPVFVVYTLVWLGSLKFIGCYGRYRYSISKSWLGVVTGFLLNTCLTFFFNQYAFSRIVILLSGIFLSIALPGWRLLIRLLPVSKRLPLSGRIGRTMLARNTVIVGDAESCAFVAKKLNSQVDAGYEICGIVTSNGNGDVTEPLHLNVLGNLDELRHIIREHRIQEVIFATHQVPYDQILKIIAESEGQQVNFKLIPSTFEVIIGKSSIDRIEDVPLLEIDYKLHQPVYRAIKRAFDIALAVLLLILLLPVFMIRRIFSGRKLQKRVVFGRKNRKISVYEIATSRARLLDKYLYLWAVFKGDLSFVGTCLQDADGSAEPSGRSDVLSKPGLTGLVQVNARKGLSEEDQNKYQLYYLKNYSPFLDVEILFKSIFKI